MSEKVIEKGLRARWVWWTLKLYLRVISGQTRGWERLVYRLDRDEHGHYRVWLQVIRGKSTIKHLTATSHSPRGIRGAVWALITVQYDEAA